MVTSHLPKKLSGNLLYLSSESENMLLDARKSRVLEIWVKLKWSSILIYDYTEWSAIYLVPLYGRILKHDGSTTTLVS